MEYKNLSFDELGKMFFEINLKKNPQWELMKKLKFEI